MRQSRQEELHEYFRRYASLSPGADPAKLAELYRALVTHGKRALGTVRPAWWYPLGISRELR